MTNYGPGYLTACEARRDRQNAMDAARAMHDVANAARRNTAFMQYLTDHTAVDHSVDEDVADEYNAWQYNDHPHGCDCGDCCRSYGEPD